LGGAGAGGADEQEEEEEEEDGEEKEEEEEEEEEERPLVSIHESYHSIMQVLVTNNDLFNTSLAARNSSRTSLPLLFAS
jgi:TATA-binding protein-associated factor Taf7